MPKIPEYSQLFILDLDSTDISDEKSMASIVAKESSEYIINSIQGHTSIPVDSDDNTSFLVKFPYEYYFHWIEQGQSIKILYYRGSTSTPEFNKNSWTKRHGKEIHDKLGDIIGYVFAPSSNSVNNTIVKKIKWHVNEVENIEEVTHG